MERQWNRSCILGGTSVAKQPAKLMLIRIWQHGHWWDYSHKDLWWWFETVLDLQWTSPTLHIMYWDLYWMLLFEAIVTALAAGDRHSRPAQLVKVMRVTIWAQATVLYGLVMQFYWPYAFFSLSVRTCSEQITPLGNDKNMWFARFLQ